ncbi:hypothetical protein L7F22_008445 [Adiantum nelumboides]|nr:hypothetical protein [Adiantum nelumboides]
MSTVVREPDYVINSRGGSVLGKKTILKSDHFPGCQNKRLQPQVDGAPNYRQVNSLPVYGVAIPTVDGIRKVLDLVGACKLGSKRRVLWHNLREEPVVYINGRPYVLREVERPFTNLEYTGINRARVEQMEARLKEDILQEAARFTNKVLVNDELPDGQMVDQWEPVSSDQFKLHSRFMKPSKLKDILSTMKECPSQMRSLPKKEILTCWCKTCLRGR